MEGNTNDILEQFKSFAEKQLQNHLLELDTRYRGELPESRQVEHQGYADHRKIYEDELNAQINQLGVGENAWLANEMDELKEEYISRLVSHR